MSWADSGINNEADSDFPYFKSLIVSKFSYTYQDGLFHLPNEIHNDLRHQRMGPCIIGHYNFDFWMLFLSCLGQQGNIPSHMCACLHKEWNDHNPFRFLSNAVFKCLVKVGSGMLQKGMLNNPISSKPLHISGNLPDRVACSVALAPVTEDDDSCPHRVSLPYAQAVFIIANRKSQF
jgi:hypothetical protein